MSDNSDDDIWARIRAEADLKTAPPDRAKIEIEAAETTKGHLERRVGSEPSEKLAWETTEEEPDQPRRKQSRKRNTARRAPTLLIGSTIVALLWVLAVGAYLIQHANKFGVDSSTFFANVLMLLLGPALALLAGFMGEGIAKSNREARYLINAARRMLEPDQSGENSVRTTAGAVRGEIGRLEDAIHQVANRLALIETSVENQTKALSSAGQDARGGADQLIASMEGERERLNNLLQAMADLTSQAQTSTQLAAQGIEDRAAVLANVADDLVSKSAQASHAAAGAAQRLDEAAQRAQTAIEQLDVAAGRGETALARAHDLMVLARLRADEAVGNVDVAVASLSQSAETAAQTAKTLAQSVQTETALTRDAGISQIEEMRAAAIANAAQITQALRAEAEAAQLAGTQTLAALQASADAVRFAAAEARQQALEQVSENQRRLDGVRQTAFEVGKDADAFLENRLSDARSLIEKSANLLDDTGNKIQDRFSRLAAACSDQARAVEDLLDGLDRRLSDLPEEAQSRARDIEAALSETLARLTEAGRKAAQETAALDTSFQERLRDSYSALGEVVQRLGGLSGVAPFTSPQTPSNVIPPPIVVHEVSPPAQPMIEPEKPASPPPVIETAPKTAPEIAPSTTAESQAPVTPEPLSKPVAIPPRVTVPPPPAPPPPASKLKISSPVPIEDDPFAELRTDPTATDRNGQGGNWSWKQVLSTLDAKGAKNEASRVSNLISELDLETAMDETVLDRLRAMASRSRDQARRGARELAPDAVRAMRRKLSSDPDLRANLVRFVEERRELAARGRLGGNEARVYLVTDAALEA
jgi:hypothetical protein